MENWNLRNKFERLRGRKIQIEDDLKHMSQQLELARTEHKDVLRARIVIQEVASQTQKTLAFHIEDIVTSAIVGVFPDPYKFKAEFVLNRNRTECELSLVASDGDDPIDPVSAAGGGIVDVVSFALRIASWSMKIPRTRPVLILDETFKHLSRDLMPQAGEVLRSMSDRLGMQIIMISHEPDLVDIADRVFEVTKNNVGESKVKTI